MPTATMRSPLRSSRFSSTSSPTTRPPSATTRLGEARKRKRRRARARGDGSGLAASAAQQLVRVLARRHQPGPDALDLLAVERVVEGILDVLELAVVVGLLERAAPRDRDDLVAVREVGAVVRDVHHHVADAHDGHAAAHREGPLAEGRQAVVVIDEVLGVVDARQPLALDAQVLGALRADRVDERVEAEARQAGDREIALVRDRHVSKVGYERVGEDLVELAAQPALHLVLVEEDAVLGQPARLDVPVEQDHAGAGRGEGAGGEETGGPRADHRDEMDGFVGHDRRDDSTTAEALTPTT